jgi:sialidase-1
MKIQLSYNLFFNRAHILLVALFFSLQLSAQELNHLYKSGENGYSCFRIPAIVTTTKGTVLAFAEARKNNCGDAGDIDLVVKRSLDGGKTWSDIIIVWNDAENTCGNPAPVVDQKTGKIILLSTWNLGTDHEKQIIEGTSKDTRRVYVLSSNDDGVTWSTPKEITKDVKKGSWRWYATGPGNGIQMRKGKHKGRLVVACDHIDDEHKNYSHAIYSDDGGETWRLGGTAPGEHVNESTVAQLPNGKLMLNMRHPGDEKMRQVALSRDGGKKWYNQHNDSALIEPVCQGSLLAYVYPGKQEFIAFSNPSSKTARANMTVKLSYDNGKTWTKQKVLNVGPSAYSNLVVLPNGNLACLYEAGKEKPYEGIVFEEIPLDSFQ